MLIKDVGVSSVVFSRANGNYSREYKSEINQFRNNDYIYIIFPDEVVGGASHNETVVIEVNRASASGPDRFYTRYNQNVQAYGSFGGWIPVGLFSSNFHETDTGIVFAAQPVNLALGLRWLPGESNFYIGASIAAGWAITSRTSVPAQSTDGSSDGFTLATVSGTLLFDINSLFYIGPTYIADFRSGKTDPGFAGTIGFGPKLLKLVAGLGED